MQKTLCACISFSIWVGANSFTLCAVIPAGTTLIARTVDPVSTHERFGAAIRASLEHDVVVNGRVLLRAGTHVTGVVEGSLKPPSKGAVIVNLKSISVNGNNVPVKTTGAYHLPPRFSTKRGMTVSGRETNYPRETPMAFRLAQPLHI